MAAKDMTQAVATAGGLIGGGLALGGGAIGAGIGTASPVTPSSAASPASPRRRASSPASSS